MAIYKHKEEEEILKFWKKKKIYEKARKKNKNKKKFYFLQGPPYTSGRIHIGTAWNNCLKDVALRFFRMRGFDVWDRGGYDTHGLPIANNVQKKLKLKYKEDIEKFGVGKFVKECKKFALEGAKTMSEDLEKLGVWMDFDNPYMTLSNDYIGGEWFFVKKAWEQKRIYKDKKIIHWCPNCETGLAKHELDYKNIKDDSIFLRFKIKPKKSKISGPQKSQGDFLGNKKNEYLIVWTTTPWTIPFNLAVMVNPNLDYVRVKSEDEKVYIIAKALANILMTSVFEKKFKVLEEFKGKKLEGVEYEHPFYSELKEIFDELKKKYNNVHTIVLSEQYVDTTAGSGLVHCAPGCGPEDKEVGDEYNLPAFNKIDGKGSFEDMGPFSGMIARKDDNKFKELLDKKGFLMKTVEIEHDYPHCWRCHNPVVFRATEQWFLKTKDLIPKLLKENEKVLWVPKFGKFSYDKWIENLRDNSIVRQRFWGCPFPLWKCDNCGGIEVVGSISELKKKAGKIPPDLHKPWVDEVKWKCPKCKKGTMIRDPDILDVWVDAGTAGWNCLYYPIKKEYFEKLFPSDFILEATEQVRLWFYMLNLCSLIALGKPSYKAVYMHGMILDFQGMKMSKSSGNIISPSEVLEKAGADGLRYYMCQNTAGKNFNFSFDELKVKQRNLGILWNTKNYLEGLEKQGFKFSNFKKAKIGVEEKYILSKVNSTINEVTKLFEKFELDKTISKIEDLFLEISRTYIKFIRDKISEGNEKEKQAVFDALFYSLKKTILMFSVIAPFITEKIWQDLKEEFKDGFKEESIHLASWPEVDKKLINKKLEKEISFIKQIIESGLAIRSAEKINVRWPLPKIVISSENKEVKDACETFKDTILNQLNIKKLKVNILENVKNIKGNEFKNGKISFDLKINEELEAEGFARELSRRIQALRKKAKLTKLNLINLEIKGDENLFKKFDKFKLTDWIKKRTNSKEIKYVKNLVGLKFEDRFKIRGKEFFFGF